MGISGDTEAPPAEVIRETSQGRTTRIDDEFSAFDGNQALAFRKLIQLDSFSLTAAPP